MLVAHALIRVGSQDSCPENRHLYAQLLDFKVSVMVSPAWSIQVTA